MENYKEKFVQFLAAKGVKYIDHDERVVELRYGAENITSLRILVFFDRNNENAVHFVGTDICTFKDEKIPAALVTCNQLNGKFRWIKFYIDEDQEMRAEADAVLDINSVGEECYELVGRLVGIVDEAYPDIMKAMFM